MHILGIDTSCDDSAAGVVTDGRNMLSNIIASQVDLHQEYGGVVPEVASRAHLVNLPLVIERSLKQAGLEYSDLDAIAVTHGPGLVGALLVGVAAAKAMTYSLGIPLIPVHHLLGHLYACWLARPGLSLPAVCLLASGGHTTLLFWEGHGKVRVIGRTLDDAAGEAFDKVARFLGLGYPGGPAVEKTALQGDPWAVSFPRAWLNKDSLDFSFSGLKTAVVNYWRQARENAPDTLPDVAASFQQAVVDVLVEKAARAVRTLGTESLVLGGGVAANGTLRSAMEAEALKQGWQFTVPRRDLCTDNGAMVAAAGYFLARNGRFADRYLEAYPSLGLENFLAG